MSLQSLSRLLQHGNGQLMAGCQTERVALVADVPMRAPGPVLHPPLMMRGEVARFSHKAKRVLLGHPGKPLRGIWLKREQAVFGTDHHILPLRAILDARDDTNRLVGVLKTGRERGAGGAGLGECLLGVVGTAASVFGGVCC